MEKNLEAQLNELMVKNHKKFLELMEKTSQSFKDRCGKDFSFRNKENFHIMDGSSSDDYFRSLETVENWIDKSIDDIRNYIKPLSYPLFVHLYLDLIQKELWDEGNSIF
jgi:hypothetical protein